jgi:hypothetical protein
MDWGRSSFLGRLVAVNCQWQACEGMTQQRPSSHQQKSEPRLQRQGLRGTGSYDRDAGNTLVASGPARARPPGTPARACPWGRIPCLSGADKNSEGSNTRRIHFPGHSIHYKCSFPCGTGPILLFSSPPPAQQEHGIRMQLALLQCLLPSTVCALDASFVDITTTMVNGNGQIQGGGWNNSTDTYAALTNSLPNFP